MSPEQKTAIHEEIVPRLDFGFLEQPHLQQQGMHQPTAHHHPTHQSPTGLRNPLLSPSSKYPPVGLTGWQPSPLFAPGFYSDPPFIPYNRSRHQNGAEGQEKQPAFPFGMFPSGLEGMPMPGFPASGQSHHHNNHSYNNNGSTESSGGSAGSAGGFSDSSNLDAEKKEDTVVTCQSESACCLTVWLCACSPSPSL